MMNRIAFHGPDYSGMYVGGEVTLGFRGLSVNEQNCNVQPIYNEDNTLVGVFNGTLYNYQIIKKELQDSGHTFATSVNNEAILHLYEEYGVEVFSHLRGMFSFAVYDLENKKLFCARDIFGTKPFYYTHIGGDIMFGSEIKSFLEYPGFKKELNKEALENYLTFQYSVMSETFFKGVYKLPPAHYLLYEDKELSVTRYAGNDIEERYIGNAFIFTKKEREKIMRRPKGKFSPQEITAPYNKICIDKNGAALDDITKMHTLDIRLRMTGDILLKADKISMANSLEIDAPFLDIEVFKAASKLPAELRCNKSRTKHAFRKAAQKKLPQEIAGKKKSGFPVPIRMWLREEKYYSLVKNYFVSPAAEKYFNVNSILKLLDVHKRGRRDNSRKIWAVFMFLVWHEQFFPEEL